MPDANWQLPDDIWQLPDEHLAIWQLPDQVFLHYMKSALAEECTDSGRCRPGQKPEEEVSRNETPKIKMKEEGQLWKSLAKLPRRDI